MRVCVCACVCVRARARSPRRISCTTSCPSSNKCGPTTRTAWQRRQHASEPTPARRRSDAPLHLEVEAVTSPPGGRSVRQFVPARLSDASSPRAGSRRTLEPLGDVVSSAVMPLALDGCSRALPTFQLIIKLCTTAAPSKCVAHTLARPASTAHPRFSRCHHPCGCAHVCHSWNSALKRRSQTLHVECLLV